MVSSYLSTYQQYIMTQKLLLIIFLSSIISGCVNTQDNLSEDIKLEIKVTLEKLAVDNLKAW